MYIVTRADVIVDRNRPTNNHYVLRDMIIGRSNNNRNHRRVPARDNDQGGARDPKIIIIKKENVKG